MTSRLVNMKVDPHPKTTKELVKETKSNRINRVYYSNKFDLLDIRELGIVQCDKKSTYDQVALSKSKNESIEFYGFDRKGSYFNLSITIISLYPNLDSPNDESNWRLAKASFLYVNVENNCKYKYNCEQLIDYESKRENPTKHDIKNVYKIGSLSIETVLPFSLTRIFFNGLVTRTSPVKEVEELISAKFTISTHPTCDKFDYKYRFNVNYMSERISQQSKSDSNSNNVKQMLEEMLEDRLDQTLMFQGQLELLSKIDSSVTDNTAPIERFIMWGAKLKRFINPINEIRSENEPIKRENLIMWTECGHWIHLARLSNRRNLVYGMINNSYEYASPLYGAKLLSPDGSGQCPVECGFNNLDTFTSLKKGDKIQLIGFKKKDYTIEVLENKSESNLMRVLVNGFEGWAQIGNEAAGNLGSGLRIAQQSLWALSIEPERKFSSLTDHLASEKLLGGKGNSLVELNRLIRSGSLRSHQKSPPISVPKGIVVTCMAYQLWLNSNPIILSTLDKLNATRRALAAKSVNLNPMSNDYLTMVQKQQILKEKCAETSAILNSNPLPPKLKEYLRAKLLQQFKQEELMDDGKVFAVRSSAVGEDSLETSAAGQMRTILDARGFEAICKSIVDCWSSQFDLEAIIYKSQNGLPLNLPMAVVVQELIQCQVAGVAATCDPLTGNREQLEILANPGLGEGVVSGGEADTIKVSLQSLGWNTENECVQENLSFEKKKVKDIIEKCQETCCLSDKQIIALSQLLIQLRQVYDIKDREIEWGITMTSPKQTSNSSSSSSSSSEEDEEDNKKVNKGKFNIHLLQSRPLTHLYKLSAREVDHEQDSGFTCPLDIVSRANLGEVMPGTLCPLASSYFLTVCSTVHPHKPFEKDHTFKSFTGTSFAFYGQMVCMILTHNDILSKFAMGNNDDDQGMKLMVGTTPDGPNLKNMERIEDLNREKLHPLSLITKDMFLRLLAFDMGYIQVKNRKNKISMKRTNLENDLKSLDKIVSELDSVSLNSIKSPLNNKRLNYWPFELNIDPLKAEVRQDIIKLFERICKSSEPLLNSWRNHMIATILSMVFNMISLKILEKQTAYGTKSKSDKTSEILNDFSILVRGGPKTESGDISQLLEELIICLNDEEKLESAKGMTPKELYDLLTAQDEIKSKSYKLFARFMQKNGHRAFKEFDFAAPTWSDDPSYIIKSLATRLRHYSSSPKDLKDELNKKKHAQQVKLKQEVDEILAKVSDNRRLLVNYALPRARNAILRREKTKSRLILAIHMYRKAFRHLGGLLCLEGRLPSAELIFQLNIEEVDRVIRSTCGGELSAILYKARRRQQRARVMDRAAYPRPVLDFEDMVETIRKFSDGETFTLVEQTDNLSSGSGAGSDHKVLVKGMTSCAGCVTGRACVVSSPEEMDQIEPNDILITYSIDTSWSVYFFTLAGIVTEVGGIVSHGAVVAREYGIPTLCTAIGACSKFKTGQIVTLNANQGTCYLADTETSSSSTNHQAVNGNTVGDKA